MAQQNQTLDVLAAIQKLQGEEAKIANPTVSALSAAAKKFDPQDDAGLVFGGLLEGAAIGAQAKADKQTKSRLDSMKQLYEQQLQYAQYSDELERYMKKAEATKKIAQDQQGAIDQIIMTAEKMDPAQASQFVNEQLRVNPYMRELLSNLADLEGGQGNFLLSNVTVDDAGNLVGVSTDGRTYNYGDFKGRLSPEGSKTISQAKSAEWAAKTPVEQAEAQVGPLTDQEKRIAAGVAKAPQTNLNLTSAAASGVVGRGLSGEPIMPSGKEIYDLKDYAAIADKSTTAGAAIAGLSDSLSLLQQAKASGKDITGAFQTQINTINRIRERFDLGKVSAKDIADAGKAEAALGDVLASALQNLKGAVSNAEWEYLSRQVANTSRTTDENIAILERMVKLAEMGSLTEALVGEVSRGDAAFYGRAKNIVFKAQEEALRTGVPLEQIVQREYQKFYGLDQPQQAAGPGGGQPGILGAPEGMSVTNDGSSGGVPPINMPAPTTRAELDALPSGTTFIAPDGTVRRKP